MIGSDKGNNTKIYLQEKKEGFKTCGTRHKGHPIPHEPNLLCIMRNKNILKKTVLKIDQLSENYVKKLLESRMDAASWNAKFNLIQAALNNISAASDITEELVDCTIKICALIQRPQATRLGSRQ